MNLPIFPVFLQVDNILLGYYVYWFVPQKTRFVFYLLLFNYLQEVKQMFDAFDKDKSGTLDFDEFLIALRVSESDNQIFIV